MSSKTNDLLNALIISDMLCNNQCPPYGPQNCGIFGGWFNCSYYPSNSLTPSTISKSAARNIVQNYVTTENFQNHFLRYLQCSQMLTEEKKRSYMLFIGSEGENVVRSLLESDDRNILEILKGFACYLEWQHCNNRC